MTRPQHLSKIALTLFAFCVVTVITMSAQTLTTLVDFNNSNGGQPDSTLVQGSDGNFYGTASAGGTNLAGTIFKMTPAGKLSVLYNFCSLTDCNDGSDPGQLLLASDGNLYGFTVTGGANCHQLSDSGCGTIFKLTPQKTLVTLYSFCVQTNCTDGWSPDSLVLATDGNFYGTTFFGGLSDTGVAFKITPEGAFTVLNGFSDGQKPENLMQASDGNFYGTTYGCGIVFQMTPDGTLTTLHTFTASEGCTTHSGLIQASDGNLYGVTAEGGAAHSSGTVYKITTSGTLTRLHSFTCNQRDCPDGEIPVAALLQGTDGNLYGSTRGVLAGTQTNDGTIFKITTAGQLTTLHQFAYKDGAFPIAALTQATNGNFYGTTWLGGLAKCRESCGTVFTLSAGLNPSRKP
jgi:uncharacterized repeat protein (TIGR03803 family)